MVMFIFMLFQSLEEHKLAFQRAFVECFSMSADLCAHVCDEIEKTFPNLAMLFHLLLVKSYQRDGF